MHGVVSDVLENELGMRTDERTDTGIINSIWLNPGLIS
jgi:hypothetical protein